MCSLLRVKPDGRLGPADGGERGVYEWPPFLKFKAR